MMRAATALNRGVMTNVQQRVRLRGIEVHACEHDDSQLSLEVSLLAQTRSQLTHLAKSGSPDRLVHA